MPLCQLWIPTPACPCSSLPASGIPTAKLPLKHGDSRISGHLWCSDPSWRVPIVSREPWLAAGCCEILQAALGDPNPSAGIPRSPSKPCQGEQESLLSRDNHCSWFLCPQTRPGVGMLGSRAAPSSAPRADQINTNILSLQPPSSRTCTRLSPPHALALSIPASADCVNSPWECSPCHLPGKEFALSALMRSKLLSPGRAVARWCHHSRHCLSLGRSRHTKRRH